MGLHKGVQAGFLSPLPAGEGFSEGERLCSPCDTRRNLSGGYTLDTYHTRLDQRLNATAQADLSEDVRPTPSRPGREHRTYAFCDKRCELNLAPMSLEDTCFFHHCLLHCYHIFQLTEGFNGIEPNGPLSDADFAGLPLPKQVWDDEAA